MSRFDELCANFAAWHEEAWSVQIAWMRFPLVLAKALTSYLGTPETFEDIAIDDQPRRRHRYVSIATAKWNDATSAFDLRIKEDGTLLHDLDLHQSDGRFYFAIAIYLEKGPKTFPKQPFWFLFSLGWSDQKHTSLHIQRTQETFVIANENLNKDDVLQPVCTSIEKMLARDLSVSPFAKHEKDATLPVPAS